MSSVSRKEQVSTRKAINKEVKITNLEWIGNLKYTLDSQGLSNLTINIFKVEEVDISKKSYKKNMKYEICTFLYLCFQKTEYFDTDKRPI